MLYIAKKMLFEISKLGLDISWRGGWFEMDDA